jgi:hypothetical protein
VARLYRRTHDLSGHLRGESDGSRIDGVPDPPLDREDVVTIMEALFDANSKLDLLILELLGESDEEEEA